MRTEKATGLDCGSSFSQQWPAPNTLEVLLGTVRHLYRAGSLRAANADPRDTGTDSGEVVCPGRVAEIGSISDRRVRLVDAGSVHCSFGRAFWIALADGRSGLRLLRVNRENG